MSVWQLTVRRCSGNGAPSLEAWDAVRDAVRSVSFDLRTAGMPRWKQDMIAEFTEDITTKLPEQLSLAGQKYGRFLSLKAEQFDALIEEIRREFEQAVREHAAERPSNGED